MKRSMFILIFIPLFPIISFAQTNNQKPASLIDFQNQENIKIIAFSQQMKAEKELFLNAHPEVRAYFEQRAAAIKARKTAWDARHSSRNSVNPTVSTP